MRVLLASIAVAVGIAPFIRAQEESASSAGKANTYSEVPKEYEVGENTISSDGRFAILYPVRDEDSNVDPGPPNLLVRLKPYAVLNEIETGDGVMWKGGRSAVAARWERQRWGGRVASKKMGNEDLVVYQIANDKIKREEKIWSEGGGEILRSRFQGTFPEKISR